MNIANIMKRYRCLWFSCFVALFLTACGGDDGDAGAPGEPGTVVLAATNANAMTLTFDVPTIAEDGTVEVNFTLVNENGIPVQGLTADEVRFGLARLQTVVETLDDVEYDRGLQWVSYINVVVSPASLDDPDAISDPQDAIQANVERAVSDNFVDNGDGSYSYRFALNVSQVTEPIAVAYDATLAHRISAELRVGSVVANSHLDWQPSSGMTDGIATRDMVSKSTCLSCHQEDSLALHGGRRTDIENCVVCHTNTSDDPESGRTVDFTYMVHAIHMGSDRAKDGDVADPYVIFGFRNSKHDYGEVNFPQNQANCAVCHAEGDDAPANAALWQADLSDKACIGCHTNEPHFGGERETCIRCHSSTEFAPGAVEAHAELLQGGAVADALTISYDNFAVVGTNLQFEMTLTHPAITGPLDLSYFYPGTFVPPLVLVGVDVEDDFNKSTYSDREVALDAGSVTAEGAFVVSAALDDVGADGATDLTGKTVTVVPMLEMCVGKGTDNVVVPVTCDAIYEGTVASVDGEIYEQVFADDSATAFERREVIDASKCAGCHNGEGKATANPMGFPAASTDVLPHHNNEYISCALCHTSTKTTFTPTGDFIATNSSYALKAHKAEGHELETGTVLRTDCKTCHTDDGFGTGNQPDGQVWVSRNAVGTEVYTSADTGACMTCHAPFVDAGVLTHVTGNGGVFESEVLTDAENAAEACAVCHTAASLDATHGN